jgi:biotin-(acetyl-CoA carboxylase) ligase
VVVEQAGRERLLGRAEGIDDQGRLLVLRPGGGVDALSVGDVTHLRTGPAA